MQTVEVLRKGAGGRLSSRENMTIGFVAGGAKNLKRGVVADV